MCDKPKNARNIDPCLIPILQQINTENNHRYRTLLSCCGHNHYKKSIVVIENNRRVFEWFSGVELPKYYKNKKIRHRYYRKDVNGYYYIPEVIEFYKKLGEN